MSNSTIDSYHHIKNYEGEIARNAREINAFIASKRSNEPNEVLIKGGLYDTIISKDIKEEVYRFLCEFEHSLESANNS